MPTFLSQLYSATTALFRNLTYEADIVATVTDELVERLLCHLLQMTMFGCELLDEGPSKGKNALFDV